MPDAASDLDLPSEAEVCMSSSRWVRTVARFGIAAAALGMFAAGLPSTASAAPALQAVQASAPADARPASALVNCVGCVYHKSFYGSTAEIDCFTAGYVGKNQKAYWSEYACVPRDNGAYYDLKVRWNA
jgi:hypothetical protein